MNMTASTQKPASGDGVAQVSSAQAVGVSTAGSNVVDGIGDVFH